MEEWKTKGNSFWIALDGYLLLKSADNVKEQIIL